MAQIHPRRPFAPSERGSFLRPSEQTHTFDDEMFDGYEDEDDEDGGDAVPATLPAMGRAARREAALAADYTAPRNGWLKRYRGAMLASGGCAALLAATWIAWAEMMTGVSTGADWLLHHDDERLRASVSLALGALGLLVWVGTWARHTHPRRAVELGDGRGRVGMDTIAGGLRQLLLEVEHVHDAEVQVEQGRRGRLRVRAWLRVTPEARIDHTLDAVDDAAEWLVEQQLRLALAEPPLVDVRYEALDLRPRDRAAARGLDHTPTQPRQRAHSTEDA